MISTRLTQKIVPIGRIFTQEQNYFLVNPQPLPRVWEDEWSFRFLVVPFRGDNYGIQYQCPREVVFTGDIVVEYATDIAAIQCELPYDVMDNDFITTEIGQ